MAFFVSFIAEAHTYIFHISFHPCSFPALIWHVPLQCIGTPLCTFNLTYNPPKGPCQLTFFPSFNVFLLKPLNHSEPRALKSHPTSIISCYQIVQISSFRSPPGASCPVDGNLKTSKLNERVCVCGYGARPRGRPARTNHTMVHHCASIAHAPPVPVLAHISW